MNRRLIKKRHFFAAVIFILAMAGLALFGLKIPFGNQDFTLAGAPDMRLGIDIRGGVDAVFEPKNLGRLPTSEELDAARAVIEARLDRKNILDREVTVDRQNGHVLVRFPWKSDETQFDPRQAVAELGETARLTFRDRQGNVIVDGTHVEYSRVNASPGVGSFAVMLRFDAEGAKLLADATARLVGQEMPIFMDDAEISAPIVKMQITGGDAYIDNMKSYDEALGVAQKISAGALPFSLTARSHNIISPKLGAGALDVMVAAGAAAFGVICLFLLLYYRLPGFVACIALAMQVSGQLLALSLPQITLTLPGIAGIILSIGLGVDANIIISERISEELRAGKPLVNSIEAGFKRAFSSVFDGNITVMIVAFILMALGSGAILSFAYTLLTGVILNFAAGVFASRLMITSLSMFRPLQRPALYMKGWRLA